MRIGTAKIETKRTPKLKARRNHRRSGVEEEANLRDHTNVRSISSTRERAIKKRVLFFFSDAVRRSKETDELVRIYRWPWRFIGMVFKLGSTKAHINVHEKGINCVSVYLYLGHNPVSYFLLQTVIF